MNQNVSEDPLNSTNNPNLVEWHCFMGEEEILSLNNGFQVNVYLFIVVNTVTAIFGLLTNSFVICGAYSDKTLGKISKTLTILLAFGGLFISLIIQPFFVGTKFIMLANLENPSNVSYCTLMPIVIYGTRIFVGFSITIMIGITTERYIAVIYPFQYKSYRRIFAKILLISVIILPTHFVLGDVSTWYRNISKISTAALTLISYVFTVYAYRGIYLRLQELKNNVQNNRSDETPSTRKNNKKRKSLTSFLIVGSYLICYLPLVTIRSLKLDRDYLVVALYIRPWFNTLLFCSFSVHALIYGWRSTKRFLLQSKLAWMAKISRTHAAES